jgi:hypothetical protein
LSDLKASRTKHKSILSSLTALGISELPVRTNTVSRNGILASVAAAGVSLVGCQSAEASTIAYFTPNVNVGFAAGDLSHYLVAIASARFPGILLQRSSRAPVHILKVNTSHSSGNDIQVRFGFSNNGAVPFGNYGQKFSQVGSFQTSLNDYILRGTAGILTGTDFSHKYYAFSFQDSSSQTHYGWIYGSVTGVYADLNFNLISYAYNTIANQPLNMGYTPEPSTFGLGAIAALILGAAGVRKRNQVKA